MFDGLVIFIRRSNLDIETVTWTTSCVQYTQIKVSESSEFERKLGRNPKRCFSLLSVTIFNLTMAENLENDSAQVFSL